MGGTGGRRRCRPGRDEIRELTRSAPANNPAMIACWLAATKAGAVVVNTMPMPRAEELTKIVDKAEIKLALCDTRILDELVACAKRSSFLKKRRRGTLATLAIRSLSSPTRAGRPWWISGAGFGQRRTCGRCRWRISGARPRPSSMSRGRFEPWGPQRRASDAGREGPDRSIGIQSLAEVFSSARHAIFLRT
jgi:acyl-CoA synthetase (AMP-forming)/AMP-acid ligase II